MVGFLDGDLVGDAVKKVFRFYFFFLDMVVEVIIVSIDFKGVFVFFI